jgi:hypothetical protein
VRRSLARLAVLGVSAFLLGLLPAGAGAASHSAKGGLDCNGFSPLQTTYRHMLCTEVAARGSGDAAFEDNGHYIGHDEPSIDFYSRKAGSGNRATYITRLPKEPASPPNGSFRGPVWDFQLRPTDWFGMAMCDTQSYPEGTHVCRRDSDSNLQNVPTAGHAGGAYMELQLYPPGWNSALSCATGISQWCAALTIDSFQGDFAGNINPNCEEPVNFAFLTHDGVPVGPPGPDQQTGSTFTITPDVLLMNGGDKLRVNMHDSPAGLVTTITDLTTGQKGTMTASVANGFRHILWDPTHFTCNGAPYAFHPMFSTAAPPTRSGQPRAWVEWSAHTYNVAYTPEIGHFEKADANDADAQPCFTGPVIPGCLGTDLDFDGYSYHADWPNGSRNFPTPWLVQGPTTGGSGYPLVRFETDLPRIEATDLGGPCNRLTGQGCTALPPGAKFYPWPHQISVAGSCQWYMGNNIPGQITGFGGEKKAWGHLEFTNYGGGDIKTDNFAGRLMRNTC